MLFNYNKLFLFVSKLFKQVKWWHHKINQIYIKYEGKTENGWFFAIGLY